MRIDIPGSAEDYYSSTETPQGTKKFKANRPLIRELVNLRHKKLQEVIVSGGNAYTASLDLNDQFEEFISAAPDLAQTEILNVYTQELNASSSEMNKQAQKLDEETDKTLEKNKVLGQFFWVVVIIFIVAVIALKM
ncbi:hypothetical protein [Atlantibacter hermannii]|uniref:hypothetical protein n=1 Tax=Atlantibacter hermannii TaxID=565 RepID=UPI00289CE79A|nr:hypothetical protein [Atlantibacter hermannii]